MSRRSDRLKNKDRMENMDGIDIEMVDNNGNNNYKNKDNNNEINDDKKAVTLYLYSVKLCFCV